MKTQIILLSLMLSLIQLSAQTMVRKGSSSYADVLYNWDGKNLRFGSSAYSDVIVNWDGKNIRKGSSAYGDVLYNWDGKNLRQGSSGYSDVMYNWDGTNIRQGSSAYSDVLFNYDGKNVRRGSSSYSDVIYNTDGKLPIAILIYIIEQTQSIIFFDSLYDSRFNAPRSLRILRALRVVKNMNAKAAKIFAKVAENEKD